MSALIVLIITVLACAPLAALSVPRIIQALGGAVGNHLRRKTANRRHVLLEKAAADGRRLDGQTTSSSPTDDDWERINPSRSGSDEDVKLQSGNDRNWEGVVGFLHPFCNDGGGGERVLWAAIRATQSRWPKALCIVYTGDHDVSKEQILGRVKDRFNIELYHPTITFLYLTTRHHILASSWPRFTLLGQSLGSLVLAWDAFNMLVPDIFIDTMGFAFTLALSKLLFHQIPTGAYVHYPTISTDMLESLDENEDSGHGVNAGAGKGWKGKAKRQYWHIFAWLYGWVGGSVDVVMTNSSWTQHHISKLWDPSRERRKQEFPVEVVYPPVAVRELERTIQVNAEAEKSRQPILLYLAQFRPEKDHSLILRSFAELLYGPSSPTHSTSYDVDAQPSKRPTLLLVGSVRTSADETYIYSLRLLAHELHITDSVTFVINASWPSILSHLRTATIGVNGMWNEHFGIGVVEYQAAGLIAVVNDSGGPKVDIVIDLEDGPTGYRAMTEPGFAGAFARALSLTEKEKIAMRLRARRNATRFDDGVFDSRWIGQMERLKGLTRKQ